MLLKRESQISSNTHKKCQEALQLWSGQSYSPSQKIGLGKGNCRSASPCNCWVHAPSIPPSEALIWVSLFLFTHWFSHWDLMCLKALPAPPHWTEISCWVLGRDGQKGEGTDREYGWTYPPASSLEVFLQGKVAGINMQRLYPPRMDSFRYKVILKITLFHFFFFLHSASCLCEWCRYSFSHSSAATITFYISCCITY